MTAIVNPSQPTETQDVTEVALRAAMAQSAAIHRQVRGLQARLASRVAVPLVGRCFRDAGYGKFYKVLSANETDGVRVSVFSADRSGLGFVDVMVYTIDTVNGIDLQREITAEEYAKEWTSALALANSVTVG